MAPNPVWGVTDCNFIFLKKSASETRDSNTVKSTVMGGDQQTPNLQQIVPDKTITGPEPPPPQICKF